MKIPGGYGIVKTMLMAEEKEILRRLKGEIEKALGDRLDRVVLFGSRSRGDADPESDFDILVTVQSLQETDRKRVFEIAADLSLEYGTVLAVLVVPTNDFTEDRYFYLYDNIQKEGQVV
jgi:predicted nucleotidyltransferase